MAFVQGWVFGLASMFAILMYVLGFLLLSIPLPHSSGLKRYARRLIHDSFGLILTICILNVFPMIALSWQDVVWCAICGTQSTVIDASVCLGRAGCSSCGIIGTVAGPFSMRITG